MAPQLLLHLQPALARRMERVSKPTDPDGLILEAWAQGYMVGSIIIMLCITLCNIRRGVLLHKIILCELILGTFHGTFIFNHAPVYGWYLSVTAIFLNISWTLHNVAAWMKTRPFLGRKTSIVYISTVIMVQPYWVLEIYANFTYFNNINDLFLKTRAYEALFRDPWWIYTTCCLFYNIRTRYNFGIFELARIAPRLAVMLVAMVLSITFLIVDICSVTEALQSVLPVGVNPFWKLSFVFKLLTDCVILDDFKTALDKLYQYQLSKGSKEPTSKVWPGARNTTSENRTARGGGPIQALSNRTATEIGARARARSASTESKDPWITVNTGKDFDACEMDELEAPAAGHAGSSSGGGRR